MRLHAPRSFREMVARQQALAEYGYDLENIFKNAGWRRIALWGGGRIGAWLYGHLRNSGISVLCLLDRSDDIDFPFAIERLNPYKIPCREMRDKLAPAVDVIIFTGLRDYRDVFTLGKEFFDGEIIDLYSFLVEPVWIARFKRALEHVRASRATLFHLSMFAPGTRIANKTLREDSLAFVRLVDVHPLSKNNSRIYRKLYEDVPHFSDDYLKEIFIAPPMVPIGNRHGFVDRQGTYANFSNGMRVTTNQPEQYDNIIHLFGPCFIGGAFQEDGLTAASQLQKMLNANPLHDKIWCVTAHGQRPVFEFPDFLGVLNTQLNPGDICLVFDHRPTNCLPFCLDEKLDRDCVQDISWSLDRPHDFGEILIDGSGVHFTHHGAFLLARAVHKILTNHDWANDRFAAGTGAPATGHSPSLNKKALLDKHLAKYVAYLAGEKVAVPGRIGCIVMNCNPFTNGHRFLIEFAASRVAWLYIFCVEEDKSFFPFAERFSLLRRETGDMTNVKALASGELVISTATFPDYFTKETVKAEKVSSVPTLDIDIFGEHIAPSLDISVRFAGTEPNDPVTNAYNRIMRTRLPQYGIDFVEVERLGRRREEPISASTVRKLMREGNLEAIASLVPPGTLEVVKRHM
jgi:[citrate (pro-3S)-lyase] ligase